jgi:hypothetical protein
VTYQELVTKKRQGEISDEEFQEGVDELAWQTILAQDLEEELDTDE